MNHTRKKAQEAAQALHQIALDCGDTDAVDIVAHLSEQATALLIEMHFEWKQQSLSRIAAADAEYAMR